MDWNLVLQALNTASLVTFAYLLARGYLVPMPTVERYMLAPQNDRIAALEAVSRRKDEQNAELQRLQAEAIKAQGKALELITHSGGGEGRVHRP